MKTEEVKQHEHEHEQQQQKPKVPIIRLKLKVKEQQQQQQQQKQSIVESVTSSVTENSLPDIKHEHNTPTTPAYYGTFLYRPFKLFPLLPPGSLYRVLIPSKYTRFTNPALKLNYLWGNDDVFTDDSDLVCLLARSQEQQFWDKRVLVEVQVMQGSAGDKSVNRENENNLDPFNTVDANNTLAVDSDTHPHTRNHTRPQPRKYHSHDGNYIKIVKYTVNPSSMHLKRWRKRKIASINNQYCTAICTPAFKPGNPKDPYEHQATQVATKKITAKTKEKDCK